MAISLRSLECYNQVQLNRKFLEFKKHCKFLGMIIDNKSKFNNHIDYITSKVSNSIGVLYRIKYVVPWSILIKLYNTLILPYLSYVFQFGVEPATPTLIKILKFKREQCTLFVLGLFGIIPMIFLLAAIFSNSRISIITILLFIFTNLSNMKILVLP